MSEKHFTGLRPKMLIVVAAGILLLFTLLFVVVRTMLLDGYFKLEQDKTTIQVKSAMSILKEQSQQLDGIAVEYAHLDSTYNFMVEPNARYTKTTYSNDAFSHLKIKAIILVNAEGNILYKRGYDYVSGKPWYIPEEIIRNSARGGLFNDSSKAHAAGFFWTPEDVYIVSSVNVQPSDGASEYRGTLIMVRDLDPTLMAHIEGVVGAKMAIALLDKEKMTDVSQLLLKDDVVVMPLDDARVAGYAKMESIDGSEELVVSTVDDREIFKLGETTLTFLSWSTSAIAIMLALISWLFDRLVLLRLERLNEDVIHVGDLGNMRTRVRSLGGNDELSSLSHGVNGMLESLEESQYALQLEKERAQVTLESIADAVITSSASGQVLYMNAVAERLTGVNFSEAKNKKVKALFRLMTEGKTSPVDSTWITDSYSTLDEVILERPDGQEFVIRKSASPLYDRDGNTFGVVTVLHDVTMLRILSNQLSFQARHDQLTGLINRYEFDRKAQDAIDDAVNGGRTHCLAYIDLDQFKMVNDSCGHMAGDVLLRQLAHHLKSKVRSSDSLARLGGDEFALLLMGCDLSKAQVIVDGLLNAVREYRFTFDDKVFKVGASIGLTQISLDNTPSLSELLSEADSACYTAKQEGGNRIYVYRSGDKDIKEHNNQLEWVSRIHIGLEKKQFVLYSQPMLSLKPDAELHCELLIRMQGMDGTLYPPGYFLPAAERYHLMPLIDRWVVGEALSIIARKGPNFPYVCAINLSGQTFSEEGFLEFVLSQITKHGVKPRKICFEITETAVIANLDKARQFMQALREIGCRFSLDDFGSGLSSFAYLKNLDVDFLKIDGMFVKTIANNKVDRAMVESINNVGHIMGIHTIAEFAETEAILDVLKEIGVDYAQGYVIAEPELFEDTFFVKK